MAEDQISGPFRYSDRADAGHYLAKALAEYSGRPDTVVLALPRGGVLVALEIAQALAAPLDIVVVRKLGVPGREELAFGAIASGGERVLNGDVVATFGLSGELIEAVEARERDEIERRELAYRGQRPRITLTQKTAILVDDGLATGATMLAAVSAVRSRLPARVVVAVPTAAAETCARLRSEVDELVCPLVPGSFYAVSLWYDHFQQVSDEEVREALRSAWEAESR